MAMRGFRTLVAVLFSVLATALLLPNGAWARDDVPDDIAGQRNPVTSLAPDEIKYFARQFRAQCARCHGERGDGGGEEAAAQEVPPANFTDAAYMGTRSDGQLFFQIRQGGGDRCAMPAFGPKSDYGWSEDKIWRIVAFVRRFARPSGE